MRNQLVGKYLLILYQSRGHLKGRLSFGGIDRPGLYAVTHRTNKVDFLVPDRREVKLHTVKIEANHDHG